MSLTIGHDELQRLTRDLARETGEPATQAILEALQQRACLLGDRSAETLVAARILRARRRCAALSDRDTTAVVHALGYAPDGTFAL